LVPIIYESIVTHHTVCFNNIKINQYGHDNVKSVSNIDYCHSKLTFTIYSLHFKSVNT